MASPPVSRAIRTRSAAGDLTVREVAEAVEDVFGPGSTGALDGRPGIARDEARGCLVRSSLYLIVKQRLESDDAPVADAGLERSRLSRAVRGDLARLLGVDENEVFRLHHHAAGLRAKDPEYRDIARSIDHRLAKRHGMVV